MARRLGRRTAFKYRSVTLLAECFFLATLLACTKLFASLVHVFHVVDLLTSPRKSTSRLREIPF